MTAGRGVIHADRLDARARRSMPKCMFEPFEGLGLPFRLGLHTSVLEVAYPAVHTFAARDRFSEISETDALHPTADDVPSRDYCQSATCSVRGAV